MSAQERRIGARRAGVFRGRAYVLLAIAIILIGAMAVDTEVMPVDHAQSNVFSPEAYGKKEFPRIQEMIKKAAVDAKVLAAAIATNKDAASEKYGKPGSVGPFFSVKFKGVAGDGNSGIFAVRVEDLPKDVRVRVQTGPAINGTEIRDATGVITFGEFTNQIEYQDAGAALNNEIKSTVLSNLDRDNLSGKKIDVVGVFQLINPANWLVTPIQLVVEP